MKSSIDEQNAEGEFAVDGRSSTNLGAVSEQRGPMSDFELPNTRYALGGDINIAFQVLGAGPIDIIMAPGGRLSHRVLGLGGDTKITRRRPGPRARQTPGRCSLTRASEGEIPGRIVHAGFRQIRGNAVSFQRGRVGAVGQNNEASSVGWRIAAGAFRGLAC
jgi:hypothetical protein